MQKSYDSLKDNDIEVILLAYLLKHPELLDTHFEQISNNLFANPENLKIFKVLEDFHQSQKNISIDTIKNYIPDIQSQTLKDLSLQIDQIVFSKKFFLITLKVFKNYISEENCLNLPKIKIMNLQHSRHLITLKKYF